MVVYKYLLPSNPEIKRSAAQVRDTDIFDSADLTLEDVRNPQDNILLGLLLDPRTRMDSDPAYKESYNAWKTKMPYPFLQHSTE